MKKIRKIAVEQNFAAISVGKLNELNEYELQLGPDGEENTGERGAFAGY